MKMQPAKSEDCVWEIEVRALLLGDDSLWGNPRAWHHGCHRLRKCICYPLVHAFATHGMYARVHGGKTGWWAQLLRLPVLQVGSAFLRDGQVERHVSSTLVLESDVARFCVVVLPLAFASSRRCGIGVGLSLLDMGVSNLRTLSASESFECHTQVR